jgi:hypothetical protein
VNRGIDVDDIGRVLKQRISKYELEPALRPGPTKVRVDKIEIYNPTIRKNETAKPKKVVERSDVQEAVTRTGLIEPGSARQKKEKEAIEQAQEREIRLLEESQEREMKEIEKKYEEKKSSAKSSDEQDKIEKQHKQTVTKVKKTHEKEKAKITERHKKEEKTVKKKKVKKKEIKS